jgi:peptidyl-prolyl cis-trans isomerase C
LKNTPHRIISGGLCLLLWGCGGNGVYEEEPARQIEGPSDPEAVILMLEGASFTNANFHDYVALAADENGEDLSPEILSRFFDSYVEENLLLAEAHRRNLTLSAAEKRAYLARINRQLGSDQPGADAEPPASDLLLEKLLVEKLTIEITEGVTVDPEEIQAYYTANKREFLRSEMVRVSQILLGAEDRAVGIYDRIKNASELDFRETAREVSEGVEAAKGGAMGVFELGQLPLEMEKVIFALKPGEISRVFESSYGFHIFRLDEKLAAELIEPSAAASGIELKLMEKKIAACLADFIEELKTRSEWSISTENLSFPYQKD